jgi:hypothetical protein
MIFPNHGCAVVCRTTAATVESHGASAWR